MRRRTVLTGLLVWLLVVVAASAVTWAVIDGAGEELLASDGGAGETSLPLPATTSPIAPAPSAAPTRPRGSTAPSPQGSSSPDSTTSAPGGTAVEGAWQGSPGQLAVSCAGQQVHLRFASPNNGYRVEVEHSGTLRLEAKFESGAREVRVDARCAAGVPAFRVRGDDGGAGDD